MPHFANNQPCSDKESSGSKIFFALVAASNTAEAQRFQAEHLKPLSTDQLKQDVEFLFATSEQIHPDTYAYVTKDESTLTRGGVNHR